MTDSEYSIPGVAIELFNLSRTNENSSSHSLLDFSSLFGPQSNSSCTINSMTSAWEFDHYEGEIELEIEADLFHGESNGYEGLWRGVRAKVKLPWALYP